MQPRNEPDAQHESADQQPREPAGDPSFAGELKKDRKETDRELDHGLKETFPASDPVSINPGAD